MFIELPDRGNDFEKQIPAEGIERFWSVELLRSEIFVIRGCIDGEACLDDSDLPFDLKDQVGVLVFTCASHIEVVEAVVASLCGRIRVSKMQISASFGSNFWTEKQEPRMQRAVS